MIQNRDSKDYDVIIVGGGFSGLIAARELRLLGRSVLLLEGRDRLGGRTWTDHRLGCDLEMGGTYVHWYQPHVWAEITRYGFEVVSVPEPKRAYWISEGQLHSGTVDEVYENIKNDMKHLMSESRRHLSFPYNPAQSRTLEEIDGKSIVDYISEFGLTKEKYDIMHGLIAADFSGPPEEVALTQVLRKWAFSNGDWDVHMEVATGFKLKQGTRSLVEAIASDANVEMQLSTAVTKVEHENHNVIVYTKNGEQHRANAVIITVPLATLDKIEFTPELSKEKQAATKRIRESKVSKGVKVWARIRGEIEPFITFAPGDYPLCSAQVEGVVDGDTIVVGFGSSAERLNPNDRMEVEKALHYWLPDIEVVESTGHDWVNDEFSQQTWPVLRPNQLSSYMEGVRQPENGIFLAGSTFANGWFATIDGAIETGLTVGRRVDDYLNF